MDAKALLDIVRPFGVTGLTVPDVDAPRTWVLTGKDLSPEQIAGAKAALRAALRPQPPPTPTITKIAFLRLLQPAEYAAFVNGAASDPMLLFGKALLDAALTLSSTEPSFVQMLTYCVGVKIFTQARAAAIVAAMEG